MPRLRLDTSRRITSLGCWRRLKDGSYRCGNVWVRPWQKEGTRPLRDNWRIFVRVKRKWEMYVSRQRPWGYGHAGQAKIGAGLIAAHQRGAYR